MEAAWFAVAAIVFGLWLLPVVAALRKRRPWAGVAGFAAPFMFVAAFIWGLVSCLGGSGDCSTENTGLHWAILLSIVMLMWSLTAALIPRTRPRDDSVDSGEAAASVEASRFDWALGIGGLIVAVAGVGASAWSSTAPETFAEPATVEWFAAGFAVASVCGLVVISGRHTWIYPGGPGRRWIAGGWVLALLAAYPPRPRPLVFDYEWYVSDMTLTGALLAAALAASGYALLRDYRAAAVDTTRPHSHDPARPHLTA